MMKRVALLLLLAVVASWVDLSQQAQIKSSLPCKMNFYGFSYSTVEVLNNGSSVAICLKNNSVDPLQDCLLVHGLAGIDGLRVERYKNINFTKTAQYSRDLPNIPAQSSPVCMYKVILRKSSTVYMNVVLLKFPNTRDSAVQIQPTNAYTSGFVNVTAKVKNAVMGSWSIPSAKAKNVTFIDLSGCRSTASPFVVTSTYRRQLAGCRIQTCGATGSLSSSYTCGIHAICQSNKCKKVPTVCTVTSSTIIDFLNKKHIVPDRCVYTLMKPKGSPTFNLLAAFGERRRQDVIFLDHLILELQTAGVKIYLEQGGRVRVNDQVLQLNATAQQHHGVQLSKDQTGVTAVILSAKMTVFFDGNTAHVSGTDDTAVKGLCGITNSRMMSTLTAEKSSNYSTNGCKIKHKDTLNITSNCTRMTEHCNLMKQAPFSACNSLVSPQPFINACTDTLCKYPAVDGHKCQFFEAYEKTCSLRHNMTLGEWRSTTGCPAVRRSVCENQYCSAHEFCGGKQHGGTRCFCRAIFASKYKENNTFGEPTVCMQNSATLTLAGCLLADQGIDHSVLHLKDQNCTGDMDSKTHMVTFSFNSTKTCGTEVMMNNSRIIYKNTVMTRNSSLYGIINRHDEVQIDFSCYYNQPDVKSVSFKIKDSSVVQKIVSGVWNYTLMMNAYTDSAHKNLIKPNTDIQLNQKIWVELKTKGLDGKLIAIVTDSCWATHQPSPNASLRYDLIKNKCANRADQTVQVMGNGQGLSNSFSFNMFEFSGKTPEVYLHCKLELCVKQGKTCVPNCGGGARRRRSSMSKYVDENSALITMVWSK